MATFSTSNDITEVSPNPGYKEVIVETPSSCSAADSVLISLSTAGISAAGLLTVSGYMTSSTTGKVVADQPTTSVTNGLLTITVPSTYDAGKRVYRIIGASK